MTERDKQTAALLLEWCRTIVDHRLGWEEWLIRRARQSV